MSDQDFSALRLVHPNARNPRRFEQPEYIKALLTVASRSVHLGITVMDSQTRFLSVNAALAYQCGRTADQHLGKTPHEVSGDLSRQMEPTFEDVLRTGKPVSVWPAGQLRDNPEFDYWFNYCFPISDESGRVQQLGLFVLNVTAEEASNEIFDHLAFDSNFLRTDYSALLRELDEAIYGYHLGMSRSFQELSSPATDVARKADHFRLRLQHLDNEVRRMRELIRAVIAQLPIPKC